MKKLILLLMLVISSVTHAGDITGKVHVINVNKHPGWNGVLFQLVGTNGQLLTVDPDCGNSTWAMFRMDTNLDNALLSVLMTAKSTETQVRVATSGCLTPPDVPSTIPEVQWVDLDIRD